MVPRSHPTTPGRDWNTNPVAPGVSVCLYRLTDPRPPGTFTTQVPPGTSSTATSTLDLLFEDPSHKSVSPVARFRTTHTPPS